MKTSSKILLGVSLACCIVAAYFFFLLCSKPAPPTQLHADVTHGKQMFIGRYKKPTRQVIPYSVVPGGVHSLDDLERAKGSGLLPSDFDMSKVQFKLLDRDMDVHVTFMKDGKLHWSSRTIHVKAGEPVFTDGKYTILTRCGNLISFIVPKGADTQEIPSDGTIAVTQPTESGDFSSVLYPPESFTTPGQTYESMPGPPGFPSGGIVCCAAGYTPPRLTVPDGDDPGLLLFLTMGAILLALTLKQEINRRVK